MYSERLLALFHSRAHAGSLEGATHYGEAGTPGQGPYLRLWLCVEEGRVRQARYRTYGCPAAIACAEALCEWAEGHLPDERLAEETLAELAGGVPEEKTHCPRLVVDAWNRTVELN
jgi:nitrogen fixation NifU-like protein